MKKMKDLINSKITIFLLKKEYKHQNSASQLWCFDYKFRFLNLSLLWSARAELNAVMPFIKEFLTYSLLTYSVDFGTY